VTVTVTDKRGKSAKASVNQPVSDEMSEDSGLKGKIYKSQQHSASDNPQYDSGGGPEEKMSGGMPPYSGNRKIPNEEKDAPEFSRMDPEEIGDEFRGITSDAISKALLDPNRANARKGKQMTDVMKQLNPQWPDEELDPEAKKRYKKFSFPQRPFAKKLPPKPKFALKAGKAAVNEVDLGMTVDFGSFEVPFIFKYTVYFFGFFFFL
jgi:hypothetical protein